MREEEGGAKYINSPETVVYRKGRELFGLWEARDAIRKRDEAFLVEGYTDCLSLVMAGVTVAVASLGTALTEQQARLLKRFTAKVAILYDGDSAGLSAARRGVDVLLAAGMTARIIVLPEGEDPDSFVRKQGSEALWKLRNESSLSPVDLQLALAKRSKTAVADAAKELVASAALISSPVEQDIFLQEISGKTAISLDALKREMGRVRTPPRTETNQTAREAWPQPGPLAVLASCLIRQPEIRPDVFAKWQPEGIPDAHMAQMLGFMYEEWRGGEVSSGEALLDRFTESPVREFIVEALFESEHADEDRTLEIDRQMADDCLRALRADGVREEIAEIKRELKANPADAALLSRLKEAMQRQKECRES